MIRAKSFMAIAMVVGAFAPAVGQEPLSGFTPDHARQEQAHEKIMLAVPNPQSAEQLHKRITVEPHIAGSPGDRRTAEYIAHQFQQLGLKVSIEEFDVLLSEPRRVSLQILEPGSWAGPTPELAHGRADSFLATGFNAYSGSGDVISNVVFANYGMPSDFAMLRKMGVSAEGKILIVRRGGSENYRGVKVKIAEEEKAAGVLIYSDPDDDGYHAGDTYPKGPWRPPTGVQRGTVMYEFIRPGDPTTPETPSLPGAKHVPLESTGTLPHIPVLPLSSSDAGQILSRLGGLAAPREWQGGLPFTYHLGPGPGRVRLRVQMNNSIKPIWVVVGQIEGRQHADEVVIVGNHRDAWVYGGVDPGTGTTAMLETIRGLSELMKTGWRPDRSIWFCSWDAEEQGMIGSVEWAERHAEELRRRAIVYINLDTAAAGGGNQFEAATVPSLKNFLGEVAADVEDPAGGSVLQRAERSALGNPTSPSEAIPGVNNSPATLAEDDVGGGTDYIAFLDHLGIASADFGFGDEYGAYHSALDTHDYVRRFADPGFRYEVAAAKYLGILTMRLAEADLLPFDYRPYAREVLLSLSRSEAEVEEAGESDKVDFKAARKAAERLLQTATEVQLRYAGSVDKGVIPPNLEEANAILSKAERNFILPAGLPGRPWYKHAIFSPGYYTADAPVVLPGVEWGLERRDYREAQKQLDFVSSCLDAAQQQLASLLHDGH